MTFYALEIPESSVQITSSSKVLGDSDPAIEVTFKIKPPKWTSKDGIGLISIGFPKWYNVRGKNNMMYNDKARDKCRSPDMRITASTPRKTSRSLEIRYD